MGTSYSLLRVHEPIRAPEDDPGEPLVQGDSVAMIAGGDRVVAIERG